MATDELSSLYDCESDGVDAMATSSEESDQEGDTNQTSSSSCSVSSNFSEEFSSSSETDSQRSESNNRAVIHPSIEQQLFPGSEISVFQSHLLLYQFYV